MHFEILTLFPDFFTTPLKQSILGRATSKKLVSMQTVNIRDFATDKNKTVDDKVFGSGKGMLIRAPEISKAIDGSKKKYPRSITIYFSPTGIPLTQTLAQSLANDTRDKILICGHYEGVDQRVIDESVDLEISVGEAVLTGGEIPALYFIDSLVRLLPGVISSPESHMQETFSEMFYGKGEYPQYTRPKLWNGKSVPEVLVSGNDKKIDEWKFENLKNIDDIEKKILHLRRSSFSEKKPYKTRKTLLRNHSKNDVEIWDKWMNDPQVTEFVRHTLPVTSAHNQWYYNWSYYNLYGLFLSIIDKKTSEYIGNISLEINKENPFIARIGLLIGEKKFWNKGYGFDTVMSILNISFETLGLEKVCLDVFTENIAAQKLYEKCGFVKIGRSKKYYQKNGEFFDAYLYEKYARCE